MTEFMDSRLPEPFWAKCIPEPNSGCWLWLGGGYPKFAIRTAIGQTTRGAARFAFETLVHAIPDGVVVYRECDNDRCINPAHGHVAPAISNHEIYKAWTEMLQRCENPKNASYAHYGARGISVCSRWHTFKNFLADMGERPAGASLDRIDPDGNYEPSNCRWADSKTQTQNRAATKATEDMVAEIRARYAAGGITHLDLAREYGIARPTVTNILNGRAWPQDDQEPT